MLDSPHTNYLEYPEIFCCMKDKNYGDLYSLVSRVRVRSRE